MITKNDIKKFIIENRQYLREHFHVEKIGMFGSFANDTQTQNSDIDLIVEFEQGTPALHELKHELRLFFKDRFHRNVDIANKKYLKPFIKEEIISEAEYIE